MNEERKRIDDFVKSFANLSSDEQKEVVKELMPKLCEIVMKDTTMMQEMMPKCMEMMKEMNFPMMTMMSQMMGR
ncbi:MAG: hypothetical protein ABDK94_10665 [Atribacterota bacterium]